MCELFAVCAKKKIKLNTYLNEFFEHSNEHPNGWGMAVFDNPQVNIYREEIKAKDSKFLKELIDDGINSAKIFAHIRRATIGEISVRNCHPFVLKDDLGVDWYLMHNGTIFESDELGKFWTKQNGTTDSERILFYIVNKINEKIKENGGFISTEDKFQIMDQSVLYLSKDNKLNLIVYDGEYFYIHKNQHETLYVKENEDATIFSTTPLDGDKWEEVLHNQLLVYKDGKLLYKGTEHTNTYYYNEEHYKYLFMAYAGM